MKKFRIVKCKKCGTEYQMPDIYPDKEINMEDCPVCKDISKKLKELLGI